ncbi:MAG: hypothetical protein Q4B70_18725 [Lachnospiraceae bacterium]|nr:hypothetical protein [Lachnospiraceae bacterium]
MSQQDKNMTNNTIYHRTNRTITPIFYNEYSTSDKAITAGKKLADKNTEFEEVLGKRIISFKYNILSLFLECDTGHILKFTANPQALLCDILDEMPLCENIDTYYIVDAKGNTDKWTSSIFITYQNKVLKRIHKERCIVWLYFCNTKTLLTCIRSNVLEYPYFILDIFNEQ